MKKLDLSNSVGMMLALATKSQERLAELEIKKQLGLTPAQWKVILALDITDGLTQKEVADMIYVDSSTLVPVIDKMEKDGLVQRKPDAKDRRVNRIFLTKKAESTVDSIVLIILQLRKMIYQGISESSIESLKNTLKIILENSNTAIANTKTTKS